MARQAYRFGFRPVDEGTDLRVPVIRPESKKLEFPDPPVRLVPSKPAKASRRLQIPEREEHGSRTHEPGVEVLIDAANPDFLEHDRGNESMYRKAIPWVWFALVAMTIGGAIAWSLTRVQKAETQAGEIPTATQSVLGNEANEEMEATQANDRIETTIRKFFTTTDIDTLTRMVRHPERVRPLMKKYYGDNPIPISRVNRTSLFQPVTFDNLSNFWMVTVELTDRSTRNMILEILDTGEPRVDWETLVCYQPMAWDSFATTRPAGVELDFRVYLETDMFFSHEFADATSWKCYRLTALNSAETLFGYAKADSEVAKSLARLPSTSRGRKDSVIVRLSIPEGLQSPRGVIIEKLISPRWIHVLPPTD